MIVEHVREFFERHHIGDERVVVACSGGVDSTALLIALSEFHRNVLCAHINHYLRGADSDGDEQFVRNLCAKLGVPLEVRDGAVDDEAIRRSGLEAAARDVRYRLLQEVRAGSGFIATAHQKNDQAETVVMRMLTGTGLAGLRGIHPLRDDGFIRPLLDCTREDIVAFLEARGVTPRVDRMNADPRFLRNRVRIALRDFDPAAIENIAAIADQARQMWPLVEATIDRAEREHVRVAENEAHFASWPDDAWMRQALLHRHIQRLDAHSRDVSAKDLERLAGSVDSIKRVTVTKSLELIRRGDALVLRRRPSPALDFELTVRAGERVYIPEIGATIEVKGPDATFTVRNRRRGDRFRHKKLKDFLIDRKIAAEVRDRLPLLVWNEEILWVGGVETSDRHKVTSPSGDLYEVVLAW